MEICRVTSDLNRYMLEQDNALEAADYFEDRITERAEELMQKGAECDPFTIPMLGDIVDYKAMGDVLDLLARKQYQDAGELLHARLCAYAEAVARIRAEQQLEQEF